MNVAASKGPTITQRSFAAANRRPVRCRCPRPRHRWGLAAHRAHGDESPLGRGKAALGDGRPLGFWDIHARMLLRGAKVERRAPTRAVFKLLAATRIAFLIVSFDLSFD